MIFSSHSFMMPSTRPLSLRLVVKSTPSPTSSRPGWIVVLIPLRNAAKTIIAISPLLILRLMAIMVFPLLMLLPLNNNPNNNPNPNPPTPVPPIPSLPVTSSPITTITSQPKSFWIHGQWPITSHFISTMALSAATSISTPPPQLIPTPTNPTISLHHHHYGTMHLSLGLTLQWLPLLPLQLCWGPNWVITSPPVGLPLSR